MLAMVRARWRADVIRRCVTAMGRHAHGPPCIPVMGPFFVSDAKPDDLGRHGAPGPGPQS